MLGLLESEPDAFLRGNADQDGLSDEAIDQLIADRQTARANKEWAESDRIRDQLTEAGIILEDAAGETRWRRK